MLKYEVEQIFNYKMTVARVCSEQSIQFLVPPINFLEVAILNKAYYCCKEGGKE